MTACIIQCFLGLTDGATLSGDSGSIALSTGDASYGTAGSISLIAGKANSQSPSVSPTTNARAGSVTITVG